MRRFWLYVTLLLTLLLLSTPHASDGCLWDYDTLAMERERFPQANELIAGHFLRHSDAYYEWRIAERSAKPTEDQTHNDYDDIAVAYEKLGQHDRAVDTIREKMSRWPETGRYESEANLGTILIHAGRLDEGLHHIRNAINLNPDAHFGRELYQQLLVEYLIHVNKDGSVAAVDEELSYGNIGFAAFVLADRKSEYADPAEEIRAAAKGVMGMMRFGNHKSPLLLSALGDLLMSVHRDEDSKMLAARAYLRASYESKDKAAASRLREKAGHALRLQAGRELSEIESQLKREIEQGDEFFASISADEQKWIADGRDVDAEFANKYYTAPALDLPKSDWLPRDPIIRAAIFLLPILAILLTAASVCIWYVWTRWWKRNRWQGTT